jgi:hypothetical protein
MRRAMSGRWIGWKAIEMPVNQDILFPFFGKASYMYANGRLSRPEDDPHVVATQFLQELVRGSFQPGLLEPGRYPQPLLTLGHEWDNRFLTLSDIEADNRVVSAVRSRMARYSGWAPGWLRLSDMQIAPSRRASESFTAVAFEIWWNDVDDGLIVLRQGEYAVWGSHSGWRVWDLSP